MAGEGNTDFKFSNDNLDQTLLFIVFTKQYFQKLQKTDEHQKLKEMDMHIVIELVFSSTFQISIQFILKVPTTQESNELGFMFLLSFPDFSHYRQAFTILKLSWWSTYYTLSNTYNHEAFGEIRILLKPGMAAAISMLSTLFSSKQK